MFKRYFVEKLSAFFVSVMFKSTKNIKRELQLIATKEAAEFISKKMSRVDCVNSRWRVLDCGIKSVVIENGLWLEFGVFEGGTINFIALKARDKSINGFDSFEGLPEFWRIGFKKNKFDLKGNLPKVRKNVKLIKGLFKVTIPLFIAKNKLPISFLHIDCDLYSSTKEVLTGLREFIVSGTVIVFDEYFNYSGWKEGEYKAFMEFVKKEGIEFEYLTYNFLHEQVAIRIISKKNEN